MSHSTVLLLIQSHFPHYMIICKCNAHNYKVKFLGKRDKSHIELNAWICFYIALYIISEPILILAMKRRHDTIIVNQCSVSISVPPCGEMSDE